MKENAHFSSPVSHFHFLFPGFTSSHSGRGANSGHDKLKISIFRYQQLQSAKLPLQTPESMAQLQTKLHYHTHIVSQYLASLIEKYCTKNFSISVYLFSYIYFLTQLLVSVVFLIAKTSKTLKHNKIVLCSIYTLIEGLRLKTGIKRFPYILRKRSLSSGISI